MSEHWNIVKSNPNSNQAYLSPIEPKQPQKKYEGIQFRPEIEDSLSQWVNLKNISKL